MESRASEIHLSSVQFGFHFEWKFFLVSLDDGHGEHKRNERKTTTSHSCVRNFPSLLFINFVSRYFILSVLGGVTDSLDWLCYNKETVRACAWGLRLRKLCKRHRQHRKFIRFRCLCVCVCVYAKSNRSLPSHEVKIKQIRKYVDHRIAARWIAQISNQKWYDGSQEWAKWGIDNKWQRQRKCEQNENGNGPQADSRHQCQW